MRPTSFEFRDFAPFVRLLMADLRGFALAAGIAILIAWWARSRGYGAFRWFLAGVFANPALLIAFLASLPNRRLQAARIEKLKQLEVELTSTNEPRTQKPPSDELATTTETLYPAMKMLRDFRAARQKAEVPKTCTEPRQLTTPDRKAPEPKSRALAYWTGDSKFGFGIAIPFFLLTVNMLVLPQATCLSMYLAIGAGAGWIFGLGFFNMGYRGFSREGLMLTHTRRLRGRPGELIGAYLALAGIGSAGTGALLAATLLILPVAIFAIRVQFRDEIAAAQQANVQHRTLPSQWGNAETNILAEAIKHTIAKMKEAQARRDQLQTEITNSKLELDQQPENTRIRLRLVEFYLELAKLHGADRADEAHGCLQDAAALLRDRVESSVANELEMRAYVHVCWRHGDMLTGEDAIASFERGIAACRTLLKGAGTAPDLSAMGAMLHNMAVQIAKQGDPMAALDLYLQALPLQLEACALDGTDLQSREFLGNHWESILLTSQRLKHWTLLLSTAVQIDFHSTARAAERYLAATYLASAAATMRGLEQPSDDDLILIDELERTAIRLRERSLAENPQLNEDANDHALDELAARHGRTT